MIPDKTSGDFFLLPFYDTQREPFWKNALKFI